MGLFGEFENLGVTIGPLAGGIVWAQYGIQAAFVAYGVTAVLVAIVSALAVGGRASAVRAPDVAVTRS
jgi:predicted MFS family arabinose efflux permease